MSRVLLCVHDYSGNASALAEWPFLAVRPAEKGSEAVFSAAVRVRALRLRAHRVISRTRKAATGLAEWPLFCGIPRTRGPKRYFRRSCVSVNCYCGRTVWFHARTKSRPRHKHDIIVAQHLLRLSLIARGTASAQESRGPGKQIHIYVYIIQQSTVPIDTRKLERHFQPTPCVRLRCGFRVVGAFCYKCTAHETRALQRHPARRTRRRLCLRLTTII